MKLKILFLTLFVLLIGTGGILCCLAEQEKGWLFYLAEGLLATALLFIGYFYRKTVKTMNTIANGMDLLREQDFSSRLAPVGQKDADRIVELFNRLMDQLKNERLHVREQNHFLDLLISASPLGVVILDFDGNVSSMNRSARELLGIDSAEGATGKCLQDIDSPLANALQRLEKDTAETVRLSDSQIYRCSRLSFIDRGFCHPFLLIESLTDEVRKAEKKAYEKIIRMISHEVNNSVAGITSILDSVAEVLTAMEDTADVQEVMRVCSERCLSMSRFITRFADVVRIPEPQLRQESLNERVAACKLFISQLCTERNIRLHIELSQQNPTVQVDAPLFEQVLVNILKNAAESIGRDGEIRLRTAARPLLLEIADTGPGISKEAEQKLFTPFFSTKPNGQGIGLLFAREVLSRHRCTFSLRTYADGLTRFRILFPEPEPSDNVKPLHSSEDEATGI